MIIYFCLILFLKNFAFKMVASNMAAFDLSYFVNFEQVKIFSSHFADFEQVKIVNGHFTDFEQ